MAGDVSEQNIHGATSSYIAEIRGRVISYRTSGLDLDLLLQEHSAESVSRLARALNVLCVCSWMEGTGLD